MRHSLVHLRVVSAVKGITGIILYDNNDLSVIDIGKKMVRIGVDDIISGGFWVWDIENNIEYYSPKFINSLGYKDCLDFPYIPKSWQDAIELKSKQLAMNNYIKHLETEGSHPYDQEVIYNKKEGGKLRVRCVGTLLKTPDLPTIMVGTHNILYKK